MDCITEILRISPFITFMMFSWHCRLGHINEKRAKKLHRDGLLSSFDFELVDTCESCLLCKMTKMSFIGNSEKSK